MSHVLLGVPDRASHHVAVLLVLENELGVLAVIGCLGLSDEVVTSDKLYGAPLFVNERSITNMVLILSLAHAEHVVNACRFRVGVQYVGLYRAAVAGSSLLPPDGVTPLRWLDEDEHCLFPTSLS